MNNLAVKEFYSVVIGGSILCFNSGFINLITLAGSYSATVSHVTGNITRMSIAIFQEDLTVFALVSSIVFSFMFGSFVAGFLVGDSRFRLGRSYGYVLLLESGALFLSFLFVKNELVIGEWLAAFACGLQNAMATSYSGFAVRTTHMTGIITDIGSIIGQACRTDTNNSELWRLKVMVPLFLGYLLGGVGGQICYMFMKDDSMLLPCIFTGAVGSVYLLLPFVREASEQLKQGIQVVVSEGEQIFSPFTKKLTKIGSGILWHKTEDNKEQIEIVPMEYVPQPEKLSPHSGPSSYGSPGSNSGGFAPVPTTNDETLFIAPPDEDSNNGGLRSRNQSQTPGDTEFQEVKFQSF